MKDENYSKQLDIAASQYTKEKEYWLNRLAGDLEPVGFQPDYASGSEERSTAEKSFELDGELVSQLIKLTNNSDLRLYIALSAGIIALMHKYTGREDIMIGAPIFKQAVEGQLINTLLTLRNTVAGDMNFRQLLMQVSKTLYDANENQNYPIETLLYRLAIPYSQEADFPLFDAAVLLENLHERKYLDRVHLKMIFSFALEKQENRIRGNIEYNARLYREDSIDGIILHYMVLLGAALNNMDLELNRIDITPEEEKQQLLQEFNDTAVDYPLNKTIHQLFEEQVQRTPDQVGLVGPVGLTYRQLNDQSDRLAGLLIDKGVLADSIVGIMMERSIEMIISMMGILKAGGAYLPIDPDYPTERIQYILEDSKAKILLGMEEFQKEIIVNCQLLIVNYKLLKGHPRRGLNHSSGNLHQSNQLVYIIYTSGTTGWPKGVMAEHRNAINTVTWYARQYGVGEGVHVLQATDYMFDPSVEQIFGALLHGGTLFPIEKEMLSDIDGLRRFIDKNQVHLIDFVPMMLKELLGNGPRLRSLRAVFSGGEKLEKTVKDIILEKGYELYNHYGPTEITVDALAGKCGPGPVLLGKPIANVTCYILGSHETLMPREVAGELYIGGYGVARGYLNNPELTVEKFIKNRSYRTHKTYIVYKTGDLARWLADGTVEFLGRIDHQVKIRGYRIELGEIENHLRNHPQVKDALVTVFEAPGASGNKSLCAYIMGSPGAGVLDITGLKEYLSTRLPGYMTPAYFCQLDNIPLTPGGKIDRKALPLPGQQEAGSIYVPPQDELEKTLVTLWAEVLEIDPAIIGIDTDFFECGGHSLNATVLAARIHKELNVKVPMVVLFETPFIRGLARYIRGAVKEKHLAIEGVEEKEYYSLSPAQERLFILQLMEPNSTAYNLPVLMELEGFLDKEKLEGVFVQLIRRHDSFRTSFEMKDGEPVQRIHKKVEFKINIDNLLAEDTASAEEAFHRSFDLTQAPLLWVSLTKLGEGKHLLAMDMHHIIADGISTAIMVREFMALYEGKELSPLKLQYRDFSAWQNDWLGSGGMKKQEEYWKEVFQGPIPVLELPYDFPRPALQSFAGNFIRFQLEPGQAVSLKALARKENVTFFIVLLSIYTLVLSRLGSHGDVVIGTPVASRRHADLQGIIGMFVNTLALRNRLEEDCPYPVFLKEVKEQTTAAFENQEYPFEMLVEKLAVDRDAGRNPLFDVMFSLENMNIPALEITGLKATPVDFSNNTAKFDLNLSAVESGDHLLCNLEYCTTLFKKETVERFITYFKEAVSSVISHHDRRIMEIDMIPPEERNRLLVEFNDTGADFPVDKTLPQLFAEQAQRTPDQVGLVGPVGLTYRQLNDQSDLLAGLLIDNGVLADSIVGVMMERSIEMVIGILGVLKAGGVYMPIDPDYPRERIQYILEDSKAKILLGMEEYQKEIIANCQLLTVNCKLLKGRPRRGLHHSSQLAYIIYTSGTTGNPKGVMIEHRGMVNHLYAKINDLQMDERSIVAQNASQMFDISVWQFFAALIIGGRTIIFPNEIIFEPINFMAHLVMHRVTVLEVVPSYLTALLDIPVGEYSYSSLYLQYLVVTGEAVNPELLKRWFLKYPGIKVVNAYGPTEASDDITHYIMDKAPAMGQVPIGSPVQNMSIYILDKHMNLCPLGAVGELMVSGVGVGRGYLNRPELTAERFNRSHKSNRTYIFYKTGDLARWLDKGIIEFLGRIDQQVKIRGFRIELGEIETQLSGHENVKEAVVIDRTDSSGEKYLCAYVVFREADMKNHTELKSYLLQTLPEYMVPAHFVNIEKIPLSPNGKVDRKALPEPGEPGAKPESEYVAPGTDKEREIAEIWKQLLGLEKVSINENFFDAGGNSLNIIRLAMELKKQLGIEIPTAKMFQYTTIASQARYIAQVDEERSMEVDEDFETDKTKNKLKQRQNKIRR